MKTKIEIKSIWGSVLFSYEKEDNTIKDTLEEAIKSGAYLGGANLRDANLGGAYLGGANLRDANLGGANLGDANLGGAYLGDAYLGGANLGDANLGGANLGGANLGGAYLGGAYLGGANLGDAYLGGANLGGANLRDANLRGAYLGDAYLGGANLGDEWGELQSSSDVLIVGPIGSRYGYTTIYHTDKGIFVRCGCFRGSLNEFSKKVKKTHGESKHAKDYLALIDFVKVKYDEREDKE